jgi:serine/threonine protein kinase
LVVVGSEQQREALARLLERRADIGGRFHDLKRLDTGSTGHFSALFSAIDTTTQARVALKFLLPSFTGGYRDDSFDREASLLADLRGQPDIIQLVSPRAEFTENLRTNDGFDIPVSFAYYALELAKTDVGTVLANGAANTEQLLLTFRAMCRAVQRLHARDLVHRDLKPPNFLVMPDGSIRLSDFGTARRLDPVTPSLSIYAAPPGDLRYASPEMLAALHDELPIIAFKGDFFALGAILFEMFSGTILGTRIYDGPFLSDLTQVMSSVKRGQRRALFDQLIASISDARQVPTVAAFGARVPSCIRDRIDDLVRRLASLDYRVRLCDFSTVFNSVNICLLILRNEDKYQRWLAERKRRRECARAALIGSVL